MDIIKNSVVVPAAIEAVWDKMIDWRTWPSWDGGMQTVQFTDALHIGSSGRLKLKGGPEVTLLITEFQINDHYTSEFVLFGTKFVFGHMLRTLDTKHTKLTVTVIAEGATALLIGNAAKSNLIKGVPEWMNTFQTTFMENVTSPS